MSVTSLRSSLGVTRDLTYDFKQQRKSLKRKKGRFDFAKEALPNSQSLLPTNGQSVEHSMASLPPRWVDAYEGITEELNSLQNHISALEVLQKQRTTITFGDTKSKDHEIATASSAVTEMLKSCEKELMVLSEPIGTPEERKVRKSMSQSLMLRLQGYSQKFRKMQQKHLGLVQQLEPQPDLLNLDSLEEADEQTYNVAAERNEAITALVQNLNDLAGIFKDLSALIVEQGNILDRIDFNIEATVVSTEKANKELEKALNHQSCGRSVGCILLLVTLILVSILAIALKHFP